MTQPLLDAAAEFMTATDGHDSDQIIAEIVNMLSYEITAAARDQPCEECATFDLFQSAVGMLGESLGLAVVDEDEVESGEVH